jgi:hypothetical protein
VLGYSAFFKWLRDNQLEARLAGGSLEKQLKKQEKFYQRFYGKSFRIDRKKIFIGADRLPAIKAGLEAGYLNSVLVKAVPDILSEAEEQMTEAEFFFERLMKPLKEEGFKIRAEIGTDRWTNLTLAEILRRGNPAEPEEFDAKAFEKDWVTELRRVITEKGPVPKVRVGAVELIFTCNLANIPQNEKTVNKVGEIVKLDGRSYVSAVAKKVRMLSRAEEIILAAQLFVKDKTYLVCNTWEWRRDVVAHEDKGTNPPHSVARAYSLNGEFGLDSDHADWSRALSRWRLAL